MPIGFSSWKQWPRKRQGEIEPCIADTSLTKPTIFPTISLCSELFRIRPGPLLDDVPGQWINTDWILEHVPKSTSFAEGVVVSRHWLSGVESAPRPWDGSVRVEQLLVSAGGCRADSRLNSRRIEPASPTPLPMHPTTYTGTNTGQWQSLALWGLSLVGSRCLGCEKSGQECSR